MTTLIPKYDQGGTSAVNRAINEKLAETILVLDYGADPTGVTGARAYVTNALTPSYGATVVGGGSVTIPVFYNGTNWIVA